MSQELSSRHRILRNTASLTMSQVVADALLFGFYVLLSRQFGKEGLGIYAFSMAFTGGFFTLATYGLNQYFVREVSRRRGELAHYLGNFLIMRVIFSVLSLALIAVLIPVFQIGREGLIVLLLIGGSQLMYAFGGLARAAFASHEELSRIATAEVLYKGVVFVLGVALLLLEAPLTVVLWAFPIGGVAYLASMGVKTVKRYGPPVFKPDLSLMKKALRDGSPFFVTLLLATLYFRMSVILLGYFKGPEAVGIFSAPWKLVETVIIIAGFYQLSIFPALSRLNQLPGSAHRELCEKAIRNTLLVFVPIAFLFFFTAHKIIPLLFGKGFVESIVVFRLMSVYLVFAAVRHVLMAVLGSMDRQWKWVMSHTVGVGLNIVLAVVLIPRMSYLGAAAALLVAEVGMFGVASALTKWELGGLRLVPALAKPLVASVIMAFVVLWVVNHLPVLITLALGIVVCGACLVLMGAVRKGDLQVLKEALRPGRVHVANE